MAEEQRYLDLIGAAQWQDPVTGKWFKSAHNPNEVTNEQAPEFLLVLNGNGDPMWEDNQTEPPSTPV